MARYKTTKDYGAFVPPDELEVLVGSVVIVRKGVPDLDHVPYKLRDLVLEWQPWAESFVCQRGVAKSASYWWEYRTRFVDKRRMVPAPIPDFIGSFRPYQGAVIQNSIEQEEGLIELPTGSGKTVIGIGLAAALKQKTLWVTGRSTLLDQTAKSVKKFLGIEPGIIGGGKFYERDFTITMFQSLVQRIHELKNKFGLLIVDEAHHVAADSLVEICAACSAKYRFGLTATARREDERQQILQLILGPKVVSTSALAIASVLAFPEVCFIYTGIDHQPDGWADLLTKITRDEQRNSLIAGLALDEFQRCERLLILTKRIEHAKIICRLIKTSAETNRFPKKPKVIEMTGAITRKMQQLGIQSFAEYGGIMVATEELCGEGFDVPALDVLVLTMPSSEIRGHQRAGRLMRLFKSEQDKKLYDFVDEGRICRKLAEERAKEYGSMGLVEGEARYALEEIE